jgi:hypothetical protein
LFPSVTADVSFACASVTVALALGLGDGVKIKRRDIMRNYSLFDHAERLQSRGQTIPNLVAGAGGGGLAAEHSSEDGLNSIVHTLQPHLRHGYGARCFKIAK